MKATYTHNGKKYIYKVDGKQVRTSQKDYPYECVAVRLKDGEFYGICACGQYKTGYRAFRTYRRLIKQKNCRVARLGSFSAF